MQDTTTPAVSEDARIGATIRQLREDRDLKARELGQLIGLSEAMITAIERGERKATLPVCRDIAGALKVRLAAIAIGDGVPS